MIAEQISTADATIEVLSIADQDYLHEREEIVTRGIRASIAAARALHEIHSYNCGILWKASFDTFENYCRDRWEYGKSHSYRLIECGEFVEALTDKSPKGDSDGWLPKSETHFRPLLGLPKKERVKAWLEIVEKIPAYELTQKEVSEMTKRRLADSSGGKVTSAKESPERSRALNGLRRLEISVQALSNSAKINKLLSRVKQMIEDSKIKSPQP